MTALTHEQLRLVEQAGDEPVQLEDPETHQIFIVIRQEVFRRLREASEMDHSDPSLFEFEDFQPAQ